jgi:beta-carotene ketolase (CrtW type)
MLPKAFPVVNANDFKTTLSQSTSSWAKAEYLGYPLFSIGIASRIFHPEQTFKVSQVHHLTDQTQARPPSESRCSFLDIVLASSLVVLWLATLIGGFRISLDHAPLVVTVLGMFIRTFFHTGLFIVTHESIHRNISKHCFINNFFGYLTSYLYTFLAYRVLAKNHRLHHRFPGTQQDPDSAYPNKNNYFLWYFRFMNNYQADGQAWVSVIGMAIIFCILISFHIPVLNLLLFWILPMIASSFQLFTFGIFLPHRRGDSLNLDRHQASSTNLPVLWSFIACYHFGYHWEHHQYPYLSWYRLPQAHFERKA